MIYLALSERAVELLSRTSLLDEIGNAGRVLSAGPTNCMMCLLGDPNKAESVFDELKYLCSLPKLRLTDEILVIFVRTDNYGNESVHAFGGWADNPWKLDYKTKVVVNMRGQL